MINKERPHRPYIGDGHGHICGFGAEMQAEARREREERRAAKRAQETRTAIAMRNFLRDVRKFSQG
jgi:hypothetical protein